ncbi:MAG: hypothetical protein AAGU11_22490 [Syntrophobacteraceae bacterium]
MQFNIRAARELEGVVISGIVSQGRGARSDIDSGSGVPPRIDMPHTGLQFIDDLHCPNLRAPGRALAPSTRLNPFSEACLA